MNWFYKEPSGNSDPWDQKWVIACRYFRYRNQYARRIEFSSKPTKKMLADAKEHMIWANKKQFGCMG